MIKNKLSQFLLPFVLTGALLTACDSDAYTLVIGSNNVGNSSATMTQQSNDNLAKAIASGDLVTVKQLVENGASIDLDDQGINQPIRIAVKEGQVRILRYLLERGAKMETERSRAFRRVGINGATATNVLSSISGEPEILELLLQYGAKPNLVGVGVNAADSRPLPLLDLALQQGRHEFADMLKDAGARTSKQLCGEYS